MKKRGFKKQAIVSGALKLFAAKGIEGTTTRDISKTSRAAEGTIYRHFKGKDDLALNLFVESASHFTQFLKSSIAESLAPGQKLKALIGAFFEYAHRHAPAYSYVLFAHHSSFKRLPKEMPKPKDVFVEVVKEGVKQGVFRDIGENLAAAMIIGMCVRVIFFHENGLINMQREVLADEVAQASLKILKTKPEC